MPADPTGRATPRPRAGGSPLGDGKRVRRQDLAGEADLREDRVDASAPDEIGQGRRVIAGHLVGVGRGIGHYARQQAGTRDLNHVRPHVSYFSPAAFAHACRRGRTCPDPSATARA